MVAVKEGACKMKKIVILIIIAMTMTVALTGCDNTQMSVSEYNNSADYEYTIMRVMVPDGKIWYEWSLETGSRQERRLNMLRFSAHGKTEKLSEAQEMIDASLKRWRDSQAPTKKP